MQTASNGDIKGCDNKTIGEAVLSFGVRHILHQIQVSQSEIENELLEEIRIIQNSQPEIDVAKLQSQIDNLKQKKRNAIDLVLDGLISKDDLAEQNSYYYSQILTLTEKINTGNNMDAVNKKQLEGIEEYIKLVRQTDAMDIDNTEIYRDMTKKIVVHENRTVDFYLNCVPFGFRIIFHLRKPGKGRTFAVILDSCTVIQ